MICIMKSILYAFTLSKTVHGYDNILQHSELNMLLGFQLACDVYQKSCLVSVHRQPFVCCRFKIFFVSACRYCLLFFIVEKAYL